MVRRICALCIMVAASMLFMGCQAEASVPDGYDAYGMPLAAAADMAAQQEVPVALRGAGTFGDPYTIGTKEELLAFGKYVNNGCNYEGQYVFQTADIDLTGVAWTPIGLCGSENAFRGLYFGNGYVVSNLTCAHPDGNNGFFGQLGGQVWGLGIESGLISGARCGGIACAAMVFEDAVPTVINSFCNADIVGERVGGIACDFTGGSIVSCSFDGTLKGDTAGGVVCDGADMLLNCQTSFEVVYPQDAAISAENCLSEQKDAVEAAAWQNALLQESADRLSISMELLNRWMASGNKIVLEPTDSEAEGAGDTEPADTGMAGTGAYEDPYIIERAGDLRDLAFMVNYGYDFSGKYLLQTKDIDLAGEEWTPIGVCNAGRYFYGVYDGGGHTITGLSCVASEHGGLFGTLGGQVWNLGIEGGRIGGVSCGGVACAMTAEDSSPAIVNCFCSAALSGEKAGGMVCTAGDGVVANCYFSGTLTQMLANGETVDAREPSDALGGIALEGSGRILNCLTAYTHNIVPEGADIEVYTTWRVNDPAGMEIGQRNTYAQAARQRLNNSIHTSAQALNARAATFRAWDFAGTGKPFFLQKGPAFDAEILGAYIQDNAALLYSIAGVGLLSALACVVLRTREKKAPPQAASYSGAIDLWRLVFSLVIALYHSFLLYKGTVREKLFLNGGYIALVFFFMLSGFLMAQSIENTKDAQPPLGKQTLRFLTRKLRGFFLPYITAYIIAFVLSLCFEPTPPETAASMTLLFPYQALNLGMADFYPLGFYLKGSWYLSAMLLAMLVLYPTARKLGETFYRLVAPVIVLVMLGFAYQTQGCLNLVNVWGRYVYDGMYLSVGCLSLGCVCFVACRRLAAMRLRLPAKVLLSVFEWGGYILAIALAWTYSFTNMDFASLFFLALSITISFSGQSATAHIFPPSLCRVCRRLSLSVYCSHIIAVLLITATVKTTAFSIRLPLYLLMVVLVVSAFYGLTTALALTIRRIAPGVKRAFVKE